MGLFTLLCRPNMHLRESNVVSPQDGNDNKKYWHLLRRLRHNLNFCNATGK